VAGTSSSAGARSAEAQGRTLTAAAGLLNPGGRLLFTSAEAPGQCTGSVGPYRDVIDHLSLGKAAYTDLLSANGMRLLSAEPWEAGNFTYLYQKVLAERLRQARGLSEGDHRMSR